MGWGQVWGACGQRQPVGTASAACPSRKYIAVCRIAVVIAAAETTDVGGNLNERPECSFPSAADTARAFLPQFITIIIITIIIIIIITIVSSCHGQRPQALLCYVSTGNQAEMSFLKRRIHSAFEVMHS